MGVRGTKNHLTVFVSPKTTAVGDGTGDWNLAAGDALDAGDVTYVNLSTGKFNSTSPNDSRFAIVYKQMDGTIVQKNMPLDLITVALTKSYAAPVEQIATLTIPATPLAGDEYQIRLNVPFYGGLVSPQDDVNFYGNYTAKTGDSATAVATALAASLKAACDRAPVAFVAVTQSTTKVVVTGVAQPYVQSKWDSRQTLFNLELARPELLARGADEAGQTAPNPGHGTYGQVATMEEFYAGYNSDFKNRGADWPAEGNPTFGAETGATYNSSSFTFANTKIGNSVVAQRQSVVVWFKN